MKKIDGLLHTHIHHGPCHNVFFCCDEGSYMYVSKRRIFCTFKCYLNYFRAFVNIRIWRKSEGQEPRQIPLQIFTKVNKWRQQMDMRISKYWLRESSSLANMSQTKAARFAAEGLEVNIELPLVLTNPQVCRILVSGPGIEPPDFSRDCIFKIQSDFICF